ncbi:MAG TPA: DNA-3-methyladenine glycosylase [Patescibacteria group bacterium]|nr:DNA-3-methyladenine glycosylase [Patescibacteria group bacterium]
MKFTDPIMQQLVAKYPKPHFADRTEKLYENLIESIISQQLSVKASDTIYKRFVELFKKQGRQQNDTTFPTPQQILRMPDETIRLAGISFQKISYIKSVADAFVSGLIDVKKIQKMTDDEVIVALTQIRGVGKWTAEMILIFTLNRPDVFSVGDLGLRNAITKLYGITDQQKMLELSKMWQPYRSNACWYLWRSLENV